MTRTGRSAPRAEAGHLLVGLMVLIAVMMIMLTVAGQSWAFIIRRDAEAELIFRGEEYARALQFYKNEIGNYPLELKVLMQKGPHRHRYIRKLYKDPLADDGTWGKLYLSPTGKGFINPYASRRGLDPFGRPGDDPLGGARRGGGIQVSSDPFAMMDGLRRKPGGSQDQEEDASGYSEITPEEFEARGGEQQGLPIVGVVHKTKESGLKIYKNLANLNDWAFTVLLEGQETIGQAATGGTRIQQTPLQKGIGDHTNPFSLHPGAMPTERNLFQEREKKRREMQKQQREREQQEADETRQNEEQYAEDEPPPDEEYQDEEAPPDEQPDEEEDDEEEGDGEEEDPNQPPDPGR